jgi:hypothetical protein
VLVAHARTIDAFENIVSVFGPRWLAVRSVLAETVKIMRRLVMFEGPIEYVNVIELSVSLAK